jgi:hypothetical protein
MIAGNHRDAVSELSHFITKNVPFKKDARYRAL